MYPSSSRSLTSSRSLADLRLQQANNLDKLRLRFIALLNPKDLVPTLVARRVLRSHEMTAVYLKETRIDQIEKLIEILKTKNHWLGPVIDALIRNGQATLAEELLRIQAHSNGFTNI